MALPRPLVLFCAFLLAWTPGLAAQARDEDARQSARSAVTDADSATVNAIGTSIDSILGTYGVPALARMPLPAGVRDIRFTPGGSWVYGVDHVIRVMVRDGVARGEIYESWPRNLAHVKTTGPYKRIETEVAGRGCTDPRITPDRWVCRVDRPVPVDWARVVAVLDSVGVDTLPRQVPHPPSRVHVTEAGEFTMEARDGGRYNGVRYRGPSPTRPGESGIVAVQRLFGEILRNGWNTAPDSLVAFRQVARGGLSIGEDVYMIVDNAATWDSLRAAYSVPDAAENEAIDFAREQLVLLAQPGIKQCLPPVDYIRRVEARGRILVVVLGDAPKQPRVRECDKPAPRVQVVALPRRAGMTPRLYYERGGEWVGERRPAFRPAAPDR